MTARLLGLSHRCCLRRHLLLTQPRHSSPTKNNRPLRNMAMNGARNTAIQLTQQEEELFGILLKTLEHQRLNTVLRCAGGWVRDKLLGKDSHDIDIAIDNKLGGDFAEHVNTYLSSQDLETRRVRHFMSLRSPLLLLEGCLALLKSPEAFSVLDSLRDMPERPCLYSGSTYLHLVAGMAKGDPAVHLHLFAASRRACHRSDEL